jgi:hypothetical protein
MGLSSIKESTTINEQDESLGKTDDNLTAEEIADLINKTGKTLEEIVNSPVLTESEIDILFKISKFKNLQGDNEIITSFFPMESSSSSKKKSIF